MSTSYFGICFIVVEKLLFSLTFYIYYSGIFRTFQIIFFRIPRRKRRPFIGLGKEFIFFLLSLSIYIIKLFWNFFKFRFVGTQTNAPMQLVGCALKIWQNFSNFDDDTAPKKFDFKSQIFRRPARNKVAAPFRRAGVAPSQLPSAAPGRPKFAAASQLPAAAPSQLPNAAPPRRTPAARGRGTRTFVRNVCSS